MFLTGGIFLQCVGLTSAMILIAIATNFLIRAISSSHLLAAQSLKDLSKLNYAQKILFDRLPQGVVTTSNEGVITAINQVAANLFSLETADAIGKSLPDLFVEFDNLDLLEGEFDFHGGSDIKEFVLFSPSSPDPIQVNYHSKPLLDEESQKTGSIFIFQDVTRQRSLEEQLAIQERMAELLASAEEEPSHSPCGQKDFIGNTPVMRKVFSLIERVAPSEATVLVIGESGTGKELVARSIHLSGPRSDQPFMPINCGAIPETLIESELFGHKKGAFTGADADHVGLFRQAEGGTVFLDEIGELPLQTQAKLLRALQEKKVRPVGSEHSVPINVRIIAATNRNLKDEVQSKRFREDLYYRLNVIGICLPALKERKEDIPALVNSILKRIVPEDKSPVVSPAVMQMLMSYHYPGNVRELENILERAVVFGGEVILPDHLPDYVQLVEAGGEVSEAAASPLQETKIIVDDELEFPIDLDELLQSLERKYLESALKRTGGAKKKAAELLGINFRSFRYRLQKFGLNDRN